MKYRVQVMPRPEALDPQGRAVQGALQKMGFEVADCRVGKAVVVEVMATDDKAAINQVRQMAEKLLANPLIETFEVEKI